jgi:hypothetical protein
MLIDIILIFAIVFLIILIINTHNKKKYCTNILEESNL